MSTRTFVLFGIFAALFAVLIPLWAIGKEGSAGSSPEKVASSDQSAKQLFETNCGACHTLARAGTDGIVGPNLDTLLATSAESKSVVDANCLRVLNAVHHGLGGRMPAGILQGANAKLVASFVARNVDYVNPTTELQPSNQVSASQVKCGTK